MENPLVKEVLIIGGGIAGMSVAHHLIEMNNKYRSINGGNDIFKITILEKDPQYIGGKARSIEFRPDDKIKNSGKQFNFLPAEHGFRFMPGFYRNLYKVLKQIPEQLYGNVYNNLTKTDCYMLTVDAWTPPRKPDDCTPAELPIQTDFWNPIASLLKIRQQVKNVTVNLTKAGEMEFASSLLQLMLSSRMRLMNDYERVPWKDYVHADDTEAYGANYPHLVSDGLTRSLAAAKAGKTSTRSGGIILLKVLFEILWPTGTASRILHGPTNQTWLNPWKKYLEDNKVKILMNTKATYIHNNEDGLVDLVEVHSANHTDHNGSPYSLYCTPFCQDATIKLLEKQHPLEKSSFDYLVIATPVEVTAGLLEGNHRRKEDLSLAKNSLIDLDSSLNFIVQMRDSVEWMAGLVFFLNKNIDLPKGHVNLMDSTWAITGIFQTALWAKQYSLTEFGQGNVASIFSCIISNWDTPYWDPATDEEYKRDPTQEKRAAEEMTRDEVKQWAWKQVKSAWTFKDADDKNFQLEDQMLYNPSGGNAFDFIYLDDAVTQRPDKDIIDDINKFINALRTYKQRHIKAGAAVAETGNLDELNVSFGPGDFEAAYNKYKQIRNTDPDSKQIKPVIVLQNEMQLLVNTVNTYSLRPNSFTEINNLFLAGDYVRTEVDLATMEGACESGKRAVNSILYRYAIETGKRLKGPTVLLYINKGIGYICAIACVILLMALSLTLASCGKIPVIAGASVQAAVSLFILVSFICSKYARYDLYWGFPLFAFFGVTPFFLPHAMMCVDYLMLLGIVTAVIVVIVARTIDARKFRRGLPFDFLGIWTRKKAQKYSQSS